MCGGTGNRFGGGDCGNGLSPRVRGNPTERLPDGRYPGSIPACAGEPTPACCRTWRSGVYPRVCGGTVTAVAVRCTPRGLSPRVRGNHAGKAAGRVLRGSIPACAGEPRPAGCAPGGCAVYPRVCGGTLADYQVRLRLNGLSPRVRGNHRHCEANQRRRRSIPACAGEPKRSASTHRRSRVYPRVCGGTSPISSFVRRCQGLSPRVRGNPLQQAVESMSKRSIPACAGEPGLFTRHGIRSQVYPRVCGGTYHGARMFVGAYGLSPRVRGNLRSARGVTKTDGSIPACAGEPRRCLDSHWRHQVYPRVCGGTRAETICISRWPGLSPRVRGNLRKLKSPGGL